MFSRRARRSRAAELVELTIALPVLLYLSLGVAEVGYFILDYMACQAAAWRAARAAAAGESLELIAARAKAGLPDRLLNNIQIVAEKRWYGIAGPETDWEPLGNVTEGSNVVNDAQPGEHVKVTVTCQHQLLTRLLPFLDPDDDGVMSISAAAVAERERR